MLIIISQLLKLMEQFKIKKVECLEKGTWLFHELKEIFICDLKTIYLEIAIFYFLAEVTFKYYILIIYYYLQFKATRFALTYGTVSEKLPHGTPPPPQKIPAN